MVSNAVIGIDLGGTKVSGALFDWESMVSSREILMLGDRTGKAVGALVMEVINNLIQWGEEFKVNVTGVGIAVPGIYHRKTGTVWAPNITGWEDYPLYSDLSGELNRKGIDVWIDSDRACCIMGEAWEGAAKGCKDAIFLAVGTGIGAGIMADGKVLRGSHDIAGATGWMSLTDPWIDGYRNCGCFEYHASGYGIAERAKDLLKNKQVAFAGAGGKSLEQVTAADVFEAYNRGDPDAKEIIAHCNEFWGKACANLVSLFNPEKIIFGGGVFGPAVQFIDDIYEEAAKWAQPVSIRSVKFERSALGQDAALYGAAFLALNNGRNL